MPSVIAAAQFFAAHVPTRSASAGDPVDGAAANSTVAQVFSEVFDNLGNNGYQTGISLAVATLSIITMLNLKVKTYIVAPVTIGAFWFGWLMWNTFTGNNNPLFPGDVSSTKIWDVAFTSDTGFLLAVAVGCIAAIFLWKKGTGLGARILLLLGAVLGASFLYNLVEAVRWA